MTVPVVLLLADSRLPSGAHAHSGGVEQAVTDGLLSTVEDLELFLRGRLQTAAPVLAGFTSAACRLTTQQTIDQQSQQTIDQQSHHANDWQSQHTIDQQSQHTVDWQPWDTAFSARTLSASLRTASRAQGAALLRTVTRMWDTPALSELRALGRPHQPLVLGAAVAAGSGTPQDAAALAVHHLLGGACSAAVRLLGLDPLTVAAVQSGLATQAAEAAEIGDLAALTSVTNDDPTTLPITSAVLPELLAARHAHSEVTLFAS